jgi:hypothetical protein
LSGCLVVCSSVRLNACLSVCVSACLFVCLSVCLFVCLSVCLFAFFFWSWGWGNVGRCEWFTSCGGLGTCNCCSDVFIGGYRHDDGRSRSRNTPTASTWAWSDGTAWDYQAWDTVTDQMRLEGYKPGTHTRRTGSGVNQITHVVGGGLGSDLLSAT